MKVVINTCYGGFDLSEKAKKLYAEARKDDDFDIDVDLYLALEVRYDPKLIEIVENLGKEANDSFSDLKIVEIPDGSHIYIENYDGKEYLLYSKSEIKGVV